MLPKRRQKSRSPRCELHDGGASRSEPPPPGSFSFPGGGAWNHARRLSFVRFFGNLLIIVLLVASAVSLSLGDRVGGLIIIAMVFLSVLLSSRCPMPVSERVLRMAYHVRIPLTESTERRTPWDSRKSAEKSRRP